MKATEIKLLGLLEGRRQFTIPIYQRPYSWTLSECARLLEDIKRVGLDEQRPTYFIGSVVYFEEAAHAIGTVPNYLVIDGQQRLTTMVLLLSAISKYLAQNEEPLQPDTSSEELLQAYLTNPLKQGDLAQRLLLTKRDKGTLMAIVNGHPVPHPSSDRVTENYAFFESAVNVNNLDSLWTGVKKLMVVSVALQGGIDNPQLIFESLNSTGKPLGQGDLIRNYVLMGQTTDVQKELYDKYWSPMEEEFRDDYSSMFNEFMRDFLTVKTNSIPNIYTVYQTFKDDYARGRTDAERVEEMVKELYEHATYYVRLRRPAREEHLQLRSALADLEKLGASVAYPFLLEAYVDCAASKLTRDELAMVVRYVESYVLRRAVCGVPTNSMSATFATFGRQLDKNSYLASVESHFLRLLYNKRFPLDIEFREVFVIRDTYHATRTRDYLLSRLENYKRKERVNVSEYTVEHVLPQNENLSDEWKNELGADWEVVREKYLHTIGNLTLTGYNSELSDRPFAVKRTMAGGFINSPIQLNQSVAVATTWNEEAIMKRAEMLADWAVRIWMIPHGDSSVVSAVTEEETSDNEPIIAPILVEETDENIE